MFPFSIKYSTQFKQINYSRNNDVLKYIDDFLVIKSAENVIIDHNKLTFTSKFFNGKSNWHILRPIEKGVFTIINKNATTTLTYQFFMYRLFIISAGMSIMMAIVSNTISIGIFCFCWLCGMNWITAIIRHKKMFKNIVKGIDIL
jgi:hypothetical protein